jgi:3alpha(or 20beta)-hydroxysteroid dehydrogenase
MSSISSAAGRVAGKVVFITGGARGQGASEAGLFCREGAIVVIGDVLDTDGEATAHALRADGFACTYVHHDVTSEAAWADVVAAIVATHGRLDVLVNNAGIFPRGGLLDTSLADWEKVIAINQTGVFLGMQAAARVMVEQRSGSIINISSVAGLQGTPGFIGYGASKWAVRGMTKSAAKELAPYGVRVNSVHPGIIETAMLHTFDEISPDVRGALNMRIPLGRTAEAVEVAQLVLYLGSDESSYSTGSEFVVDGGWMA